MFQQALVTFYPWDVLDPDLTARLDRLQGEIGITGVSLWVGFPPIAHLRVGERVPPLIRSDGGLFVRSRDRQIDAATMLAGVSADAPTQDCDPFRVLAAACAERKLVLRAKFSATRIGGWAARTPSMATVSVYDHVSTTGVCLVNPEVQRTLLAIAETVSAGTALSAMSVCDVVTAWHEASGDIRSPACLTDADRVLLSTCFCEACRKAATKAGIDVAAVRDRCRKLLQVSTEEPCAARLPIESILTEHAALRSFFHWRSSEIAAVLRRLDQAAACDVLLDRSLDPVETCQHDATVLETPAGVTTRVDRGRPLDSAIAAAACRQELGIPAERIAGEGGDALVGSLSAVVRGGVSGVEFDTVGLLTERALTVVRQAIRFARRSQQT